MKFRLPQTPSPEEMAKIEKRRTLSDANPLELDVTDEQIENAEQEEDRTTITHNLMMMDSDMTHLLYRESIGGNAGSVEISGKRYPCGGANSYVDPETGKIIVFNNIQNIKDMRVVEKNILCTFRVAMNFDIGQFVKIVDYFIESSKNKSLSNKARRTIETAIREWNVSRQNLIKKVRREME